MYKLISLFIAFLIFSISITPVYANDLTVSCNKSICALSSKDPIFSADVNWIPEKKVEKKIQISNTDTAEKDVFLKVTRKDTNNQLDKFMHIQLLDSLGNATWEGTLESMINDGTIFISKIQGNSEATIFMTAQMKSEIPNNLQGMSSQFDFSFGFDGESTTDDQQGNTPPTAITPTGQADNNSGSNSSTSSSGSGGSSDSSVLGAATENVVTGLATIANTFGIAQAIQDVAEVLGATDSAEEVLASSDTGATHTDSTAVCTDNWYWLLALVAELGIIAFILKKVTERKKKLLFVVGTAILTTTIIFLMVCTKWYALTALLPLLALPTLKRK